MSFLVEMCTDVGIKKSTNQDSMCVKEAQTDMGSVLLAVLCDGMGGLQKGEVASAAVIQAFADWFEQILPYQLAKEEFEEEIVYHWDRLIKEQNQSIAEYGRNYKIQLGTTITAMLFLENGRYLIGQVGDSRAYKITEEEIVVLTKDQTVVANEIRLGKLTPEEAENDPRRNVLLQCIGASRIVKPEFEKGEYSTNQCYMLCSDGFRHEIKAEEIKEAFAPSNNENEQMMKENIIRLIKLNKEREETDNISAILVKVV